MKSYLEFDSSYRDRELYPEPASFVVEMSLSGQGTDYITAKDPVSNASFVLVWNNLFQEYIPPPPPFPIVVDGVYSITANYLPPVGGGILAGTTRFQITTPNTTYQTFRQIRNYYVGCSLSSTLPTGGLTSRRITDYIPITLRDAIVSIESPLPDTISATASFFIQNPTPIATDTPNSIIKIFIPGSNKYGLTFTYPFWIERMEPKQVETSGLGGDNYYIGYYIQNTDTGTYRKITSFDSTTRMATLESPTPVGEDWSTAVVIPLIKYGRNFAIRKEIPEPITSLPFTRDNAVNFNFTWSSLSINREIYRIKLLNLVLPNSLLKSGRGGRAIFYPYFYVELLQLSKATTETMNVIYSNNPNSSKMLFRAVVDDTIKPEFSPFIKIDGDGMTHTLRVSPSDSFRFSVYHANGELFKTDIVEMYSPTEPNPLAQISACFSFEKV